MLKCIKILYSLLQVLLVSSSNEPNGWIIPGGGLEPEEEPSQTAIREVLEEAGVSGRLGNCLGVFEVRTSVFLKYEKWLNLIFF